MPVLTSTCGSMFRSAVLLLYVWLASFSKAISDFNTNVNRWDGEYVVLTGKCGSMSQGISPACFHYLCNAGRWFRLRTMLLVICSHQD